MLNSVSAAVLTPSIPHGFARPCIRARHRAVFHPHPGVMMQNPFRLEELHLAEFAAQFGQKIKTLVHVAARIRQAGAGDNNPAVDRRPDEKPVPARHPFHPGAGNEMIQTQRGLNGFGIQRTDRQPAGGARPKRRLEQREFFHLADFEFRRQRPSVQRNHPDEHHGAQAKHEPKNCQQRRRNGAHLTHNPNLRPLSARVQIKSGRNVWEGCRAGDPDYGDGDTPSLPDTRFRG